MLIRIIFYLRDFCEFIEEFPLLLLADIEKITGFKGVESFLMVNYQYGHNFSSPGNFLVLSLIF